MRNFDALAGLQAMVASSVDMPEGYALHGVHKQSASKTLEYAYDDWTIAQHMRNLARDGIRLIPPRQCVNGAVEPAKHARAAEG